MSLANIDFPKLFIFKSAPLNPLKLSVLLAPAERFGGGKIR